LKLVFVFLSRREVRFRILGENFEPERSHPTRQIWFPLRRLACGHYLLTSLYWPCGIEKKTMRSILVAAENVPCKQIHGTAAKCREPRIPKCQHHRTGVSELWAHDRDDDMHFNSFPKVSDLKLIMMVAAHQIAHRNAIIKLFRSPAL
jgi:hypothetical protein